jgi:creatinine amidohydrolase
MRLQLSTWAETEVYLETRKGIIMPIGSTEQHGPNGLIGTDALTADAIAIATAARADALVAPVIPVGMAQHHMAFAGSMTLRPSTLVQVIRDNVLSLARHGFRQFYFLNGHGGNISTINTAFQEIHAESSLEGGEGGISCALRNWWIGPEVKKISEELYGDREGYHATPSEVSVTQYLFPEAIKSVSMEPAPKLPPRIGDSTDYRNRYPDGRMSSDPSLATPEAGERIFKAAVDFLVSDYQDFVSSD